MTGAPPRGLGQRLRDARGKLENDVDVWVATSNSVRGAHLVPLSYLWDGTALLISTPRTSVTARNLLADSRVRLSLGPTRDVVIVDGTAEPVDPGPGESRCVRGQDRFRPAPARPALPVLPDPAVAHPGLA